MADPLCPICGLEVETTGHASLNCPAARNTWSMCCRKLHKSCMEEKFIHIVEDLHNKLENDGFELMADVRNSLIHGENFCHPTQIVIKAHESLKAFKSANARPNGKGEGGNLLNHKWKASICGFVNVNWDATLDKVKKKMGIGVIMQDHVGRYWQH